MDDPRIQAAVIAAVSAFIGVIVGGMIQSHLKEKEIQREKKVAEGAVALYLCQLRFLFMNYADSNKTYDLLFLGITPNDNNIGEIDKIVSLIEKHDPFLIVRLLNIKQVLHNIRAGSNNYWKQKKENDKPKLYGPIVDCINIDGKTGLKEVDMSIKHAFNFAESSTKIYLLEQDEFKTFLSEILGNSLYQRLRIKLKLVSNI
jgi:hypothetical protein